MRYRVIAWDAKTDTMTLSPRRDEEDAIQIGLDYLAIFPEDIVMLIEAEEGEK